MLCVQRRAVVVYAATSRRQLTIFLAVVVNNNFEGLADVLHFELERLIPHGVGGAALDHGSFLHPVVFQDDEGVRDLELSQEVTSADVPG